VTTLSSELSRIRVSAVFGAAWRRQRRRRLGWAAAFLGAALLLAVLGSYEAFWKGGSGGTGGSSLSQHVAGAAELPRGAGWYAGSARIPIRSCPRCVQVDSWASTTPYLDAPNNLPSRTMGTLGANGVIVWVIRSWQPVEPTWALKRHLLRIQPSLIHPNFEGNPTHGRVSLWLVTSWLNGSSVQVYVYFGSPVPRPSAIARAQQELDGTTFPTWQIDTPWTGPSFIRPRVICQAATEELCVAAHRWYWIK